MTTHDRAHPKHNNATPHLDWLGPINKYGEYVGFECPRCGERRTHATPALNLWRCWACDRFDRFDRLERLPRRPSNAPSTGRAELPRRRVTSVPRRLKVVA